MDNSLQSCIDGEHADFLAIDDLLDFSNDDIGGPIGSSCLTIATSESRTPSVEVPKLSSLVSSPREKKHVHQTPCVFDSDQLCVPCDDLAELEWLSNFVEESFSSGDNGPASFCFGSMVGKFATDDSQAHRESLNDSFQSTSPVSVLESNAHSREKALSFSGPDTSVPARARSKRCRTGVCFWNTQILSAEASESILESTSTTSTITSDSDMINTYYDHDDDDYNYNDDDDDYGDDDNDDETDGDRHRHYHQHNREGDRSFKTKKFNKSFDSFSNSSKPKKVKAQDGCQVVRKCLHCATQKTPQWRAGPMGPKTLCNACGVRYKSGRLCAEYRPAASPTFIENVHSNSHRKVLEMRRQRGDFMSPSGMRHEKPQCRLDRGAGLVHVVDK